MSSSHEYVLGIDPMQQNFQPTCNGLENVPLNKCDWYFGNISREVVREKLLGARDGTFLVRNATSGNDEYTLTLKKDGIDRVIKIYNNNGRYGFTKGGFGLSFDSVPDLVNYYRNASLKDYNTILDIKLLYPVSRTNQDDDAFYNNSDLEKIIQKYMESHKELNTQEIAFENFWNMYKKIEVDLDVKRQSCEVFHEAEALFTEQLKMQENWQSTAEPHEISSLKENHNLVKSRLKSLLECQNDLKISYERQKAHYLALERNIQSLKPILNELRKNEERYMT